MACTSFKKRSKGNFNVLNGTRCSLHNNQLLVSTGVPSLDSVLGGGLAVGTVLLIEEDSFGSYSKLLLKYFAAEGFVTGQHVLLASGDPAPEQLLKELPCPVLNEPEVVASTSSTKKTDEDMTIAWRYQNQPQVQSSPTLDTTFGHYYDLSKTMPESRIDVNKTTCIDVSKYSQVIKSYGQPSCPTKPQCAPLQQLLNDIQDTISRSNFSAQSKPTPTNVLRLALHGVGSPLFEDHDTEFPTRFYRFLYRLRAVVRSSYTVCIMTVPTLLLPETIWLPSVHQLSDYVINLEAFAGSEKEKNPAYKEYHGLFHLLKLPRLNTLTVRWPDTLDLAFKLRRKKLTIEKLHLPPDLSDTVSRGQSDVLGSASAITTVNTEF